MNRRWIKKTIRVGTRGSLLAQAQTDLFLERLRERYPGVVCEKVVIRTKGDRIADRPLREFGGKAVFVAEIEDAIRAGEIDCAVHSAKDMPTELAAGLSIVCALPREDVRDVLVWRAGEEFPRSSAAVIGTGSLRRSAQLAGCGIEGRCVSVRGNVPTRLEKLSCGAYDGLVLAAAGLKRLHLLDEAAYRFHYFSEEEMVPAGGQAIIAVEGREDEAAFFAPLSDASAMRELAVERGILRRMDAGCHEAVGVLARSVDAGGEGKMRVRLMRGAHGRVFRTTAQLPAGDWEPCADELVRKFLAEVG